jgi:tRNA A-37 threonylcarbamoyl transferase component Bud32
MKAGIPVPQVFRAEEMPNGFRQIEMSYIPGETLEALWLNMSSDERLDMAHQLRDIIKTMRLLSPPRGLIGDCSGQRSSRRPQD